MCDSAAHSCLCRFSGGNLQGDCLSAPGLELKPAAVYEFRTLAFYEMFVSTRAMKSRLLCSKEAGRLREESRINHEKGE